MSTRSRLLLVAFSLLLSASARAQAVPGQGPAVSVSPQVEPAALRAGAAALDTLKKLVSGQNFRTLGFETLAEASTAALGAPFVDYFVPLETLRGYSAGGDVKPLLVPGPRLLFPVLAGAHVRSSLMIARTTQGTWKPATFGAPRFMRAFAKAREAAAGAHGRPATDFVLVRVPALGAQFLAFSSATGVQFIVVQPDRRFGLRGGETLPATEVLGRMVEAARRLDAAAPG